MLSYPIHFIWAGGSKFMGARGINTIAEWRQINPEHPITLWVDNATVADAQAMQTFYKEEFSKHSIAVFTTEDEARAANFEGVLLRDISEVGLRDEYVGYEIDRMQPNYGASSDLLRYAILSSGGGAYFDSDVSPGKDALPNIEAGENIVYISHCPQKPEPSEEDLADMSLAKVGNDAFICSAKSSFMKTLTAKSRVNYDVDKKNIAQVIQIAHSGNNIQDLTVQRTGPVMVARELTSAVPQESGCWQMDASVTSGPAISSASASISSDPITIKRLQDGENEWIKSQQNTGLWLEPKPIKEMVAVDAIEAIKKTIQFEARHLHSLRLDDHMNDFMTSTKMEAPLAIQFLQQIIKKSGILDEVSYVQITGQFQETIDYAKQLQKPCLFNLTAPGITMALAFQGFMGRLMAAEKTALQSGILLVQDILLSQRPEVRKSLCLQMNKGIQLLQDISQHLEEIPEARRQEVKTFMVDRLEKYIAYGDAFNDSGNTDLPPVNVDIANVTLATLTTSLSAPQNTQAHT